MLYKNHYIFGGTWSLRSLSFKILIETELAKLCQSESEIKKKQGKIAICIVFELHRSRTISSLLIIPKFLRISYDMDCGIQSPFLANHHVASHRPWGSMLCILNFPDKINKRCLAVRECVWINCTKKSHILVHYSFLF